MDSTNPPAVPRVHLPQPAYFPLGNPDKIKPPPTELHRENSTGAALDLIAQVQGQQEGNVNAFRPRALVSPLARPTAIAMEIGDPNDPDDPSLRLNIKEDQIQSS